MREVRNVGLNPIFRLQGRKSINIIRTHPSAWPVSRINGCFFKSIHLWKKPGSWVCLRHTKGIGMFVKAGFTCEDVVYKPEDF